MPVEAKPLFRPDVLRTHLASFSFPANLASVRPKLDSFATLLASPAGANLKERDHFPVFLTLLADLLGYKPRSESPDRWTISREQYEPVEGEYADGVLGLFQPDHKEKFVVAVEGKGSKDPLDRPHGGRRLSAVEQGYRYATNLRCDWIIVSSMRETRLYHKGSDQQTFEWFETTRLAADEPLLKKFLFLLGAPRVVPFHGDCHLSELLRESESVGRELTHKFYETYANRRQDAFLDLRRDNPDVAPALVLQATQKLLDRILFCAFAEDRGLLPANTIHTTYEHQDIASRSIWENFKALFKAINEGNPRREIEAYNGGLFKPDTLLDSLKVPDDVCAAFKVLGSYDYRPAHEVAAVEMEDSQGHLIDVDILGHIFEQSITDLEKLRLDLFGMAEPVSAEAHKSRRKKEGAFYTPAFITRYIVEQALGRVLEERFETLRQKRAFLAKGKTAEALADAKVYELDSLKKPQREALIEFWEAWQQSLKTVRVLDPACGSGAFLIQAFDYLRQEHIAVNHRLAELRGGQQELGDLDRDILQNNLYGVDLNDEAVEICRLSLWIKTAARGKQLTSLDHTIRIGNSVVSDPAFAGKDKAFDWQKAFPEVFADGGFDVVIGNPPYVRQELLSAIKPHLESAYQTYHGMADLYVYFYELGLRHLKPGGRLSFVVTNKWMKAGYAEPLRKFFAEQAWIESVVDFGHAKQIFEEADVFPSIIVVRKPTTEPKPTTARLCSIPREQLRIDDLSRQIEQEGSDLPLTQLGSMSWQLEVPEVTRLLTKIQRQGIPLHEFARVKPLTGIKTAFNDAFLIDTDTKNSLVKADPKSAEVIKPYVRGQDIGRWQSEWMGWWMVVMKSSNDYSWPWDADEDTAEATFRDTYPAVYAHMKGYEPQLRKRLDQGKYWWELRSCAYWQDFAKPKIYYQLIQFHPCYAFDSVGTFGNNKTAFITSDDLYLVAVLNSGLMWWHNWRYLPHMKDEALAPNPTVLEACPIAVPSEKVRKQVAVGAGRLVELAGKAQSIRQQILDWLRVEHEIDKPNLKLQSPLELDADGFLAEVKKVRGKKKPLSAAAVKNLRDEYTQTIEPARALTAEALRLEREVSDLVNAAYGLTPDEIKLMWETAPPRMPPGRPG